MKKNEASYHFFVLGDNIAFIWKIFYKMVWILHYDFPKKITCYYFIVLNKLFR